jgi:hypothetical protein
MADRVSKESRAQQAPKAAKEIDNSDLKEFA